MLCAWYDDTYGSSRKSKQHCTSSTRSTNAHFFPGRQHLPPCLWCKAVTPGLLPSTSTFRCQSRWELAPPRPQPAVGSLLHLLRWCPRDEATFRFAQNLPDDFAEVRTAQSTKAPSRLYFTSTSRPKNCSRFMQVVSTVGMKYNLLPMVTTHWQGQAQRHMALNIAADSTLWRRRIGWWPLHTFSTAGQCGGPYLNIFLQPKGS